MDTKIMSDEEWASIRHDPNGSKKENAKRYAARLAATVDWPNLPENEAKDIKKMYRDTAHETIVKNDNLPPPILYFMDRPMDIVFR